MDGGEVVKGMVLQRGLEGLAASREPPWTVGMPAGVPIPAGESVGLAMNNEAQIVALVVVEKGARITSLDRRLKILQHEPLRSALSISTVIEQLPSHLRHHAESSLAASGTIPPATWEAIAQTLADHPSSAGAWQAIRFSDSAPSWLAGERAAVFAMERDNIELAVRLAGFDARDRPRWLGTSEPAPFLAGLDGVVAVEDNILNHELHQLHGFDLEQTFHVAAAAVFTDGRTQVTAVNINRRPAETTLGADLVYYDHDIDSYLAVQYKRLAGTVRINGQRQRVYRPSGDAHIDKQIKALRSLAASAPSAPVDYRLGSCSGYLKLCDPDVPLGSREMLPGLYIPSDYWPLLIASSDAKGPRDGDAIGYHNTARRLSNSQIIEAFRGGLIGTNGATSQTVQTAIAASVGAGNSVTLASSESLQ